MEVNIWEFLDFWWLLKFYSILDFLVEGERGFGIEFYFWLYILYVYRRLGRERVWFKMLSVIGIGREIRNK